ncbi:MAG: HEAT repeat domain-containing protein [Gemmatales bacterium]|nr:HEAT repeat domain-containing protein [Gemmatales bacterium]MDW8388467.1 HEAT repeat domain-containing protein [Gemmatales bacterium]
MLSFASLRLFARTRLAGLTRGVAAACLGLALGGCSTFIDDITAVSPEGGFWNNMKYRQQLLLDRRDPMEVLATSRDGDLRARAYRRLKTTGSPEEQAKLIQMLAEAAKSEKDLVSRLAAVEKLGEFKDPQAFQALQEAFYAPANAQARDPVVRIAAVQGMAKTGNAAAVPILSEVVLRDPSRDVRLAAADGLGRFQSADAANALVKVLKEERDIALRHKANESLRQMTGKQLPPQADQWEAYLQQRIGPDRQIAREPKSPLQQVMFWEK